MSMNRKTVWPWIAVVCSLLLVCVTFWGVNARSYAPRPVITQTGEPRDTLHAWEESGLRGRILFSFDRHLHAENEGEQPSNDNFISLAVKKNIVRKIFHVIPDESWAEVSATLSKYTLVKRQEGYFRTWLEDGTPLYILKIGDIKPVAEKVLININAGYWDAQQLSAVVRLLENHSLSSDFITISGEMSPNILNAISNYEKAH